MDKDKALKLSLEFVENVHFGEWQGSTERQEEIVTAIKKALAQLAQEREALKLALNVLEDLPGFRADIDNAITAIKEVLEKTHEN